MSWTIDPAHTTIAFSAKHLGLATVRGRFTRFSGELQVDDVNDPTTGRGRIEIEAASIDTGNEQRDGHLRSPDFLDVETHPTIVFEVRSVRAAGGDRHEVVGAVTIKGITREVTFDYEHNGTVVGPDGATRIGGSITGTINRTDWGLRWNMPLDGGRFLVSEKVKIEVDGEIAESREAVADLERAEASV